MRGAIPLCGVGVPPHMLAGGSFFLSHFHFLCFAPHISLGLHATALKSSRQQLFYYHEDISKELNA
jgi:hypothetical protein